MERDEMIKILMEKTNVSHEEAEEVLQKCNWDLIEAVIYLERKRNNEVATIVESKNKEEYKEESRKNGGVGEVIGRIFKFIGKVIGKGNRNYFEIRKENEKPIKISLTISVLLLIVAFWLVMILLVAGLFFGYKYSITGPNIKADKVNDILGKASESAGNIKDDFKEGYK